MKNFAKGPLNESIYAAAAQVLLGLALLIWPALSGRVLCYGVAALCLLYGVYRTVLYFTHDPVLAMLQHDLAAGLLGIGAGIVLIARPTPIVSLLPTLFGLLLFVGGAFTAQIAFDLHRMEEERWFVPLIAAAVLAALGGVILWYPFATAVLLMRFIGISLSLQGVGGFVFSRLLAKRRRLYYPPEE